MPNRNSYYKRRVIVFGDRFGSHRVIINLRRLHNQITADIPILADIISRRRSALRQPNGHSYRLFVIHCRVCKERRFSSRKQRRISSNKQPTVNAYICLSIQYRNSSPDIKARHAFSGGFSLH